MFVSSVAALFFLSLSLSPFFFLLLTVLLLSDVRVIIASSSLLPKQVYLQQAQSFQSLLEIWDAHHLNNAQKVGVPLLLFIATLLRVKDEEEEEEEEEDDDEEEEDEEERAARFPSLRSVHPRAAD